MRRPLCYFVCAFGAGILAAGARLPGPLPWLLFLCLLFGKGEEGAKRKTVGRILLAGLLAGFLILNLWEIRLSGDPLLGKEGGTVSFTGTVVEESLSRKSGYDGEPRLIWQGKVRTEEGRAVLVTGEAPKEVLLGCSVTCTGQVELPSGRRNPGAFDYARYLKGKGISVILRSRDLTRGEVKNRRLYLTGRCLTAVRNGLSDQMGEEERALFFAMVLGDTGLLSEEDYEAFRENGTAHVLAVSGLHVTLIYGALLRILGRKRKLWQTGVIVASLTWYGWLAQGAVSCQRALIMIFLRLLAEQKGERYDMASALAFAALCQMIRSPYAVYGAGFQMSYLAAGILTFLFPYLERRSEEAWARRIRKGKRERAILIRSLSEAFLPILLLQLLLVPYTVYTFHYLSLSGFLANIPLVYLAGLAVPLGLLGALALLLPFPDVLTAGLFQVLEQLLRLTASWNALSYQNGRFCFLIPSPGLFPILLIYTLAFLLLAEGEQIRRIRRGYQVMMKRGLLLLCFCLCFSLSVRDGFGSCDVIFPDVGQGSCLHLRAGRGIHLLVDGGGSATYDVGRKTVLPYLLSEGIGSVDLAFVTHLDEDHYGGIRALCQEGRVRQLAVSALHEKDLPKILEETGLSGDRVLLLSPGDSFVLGRYRVSVLGPLKDAGEENENSLVLLFEGRGSRLLVTGDIGSGTEEALLDRWGGGLAADILWIPHHGSRYSSSAAFTKAVSPSVAVAQVGKNRFGHPAEEVVLRYENAGSRVFRTDRQGAVGIRSGEKSRKVLTMLP